MMKKVPKRSGSGSHCLGRAALMASTSASERPSPRTGSPTRNTPVSWNPPYSLATVSADLPAWIAASNTFAAIRACSSTAERSESERPAASRGTRMYVSRASSGDWNSSGCAS